MNKSIITRMAICFGVAILIGAILISLLIYIPTEQIQNKQEEQIRVVSYNLKYGWSDYDTTFEDRKSEIVKQLLDYDADSIGVQEADSLWMDEYTGLPAMLSGYDYVGVGRDDGATSGEYASIFYNEDKYEVVESGTFWLSDRSEEVSIGWDASTYRICTWAELKNKFTGDSYVHYNTHFDHLGEEARKESTKLVLQVLELQPLPHVLTGDFNFTEGSENYNLLVSKLDDSKKVASESMSHGTINWFINFNAYIIPIVIDFVFVSKSDWEVDSYNVDNNYRVNDKPASDHYAVVATMTLK